MIDIYMTDEIEIIKITQDTWGKETRTVETVPARVENANALLSDVDGNEVRGRTFIIIPFDTDIQYHYKIKIKKIQGADFLQKDKEFIPRAITQWSNFMQQQLEVTI
jgi:hypothetical protein